MKKLKSSGNNSNKWLYLGCALIMFMIFAGLDGMLVLAVLGLIDFWMGASMCRAGNPNGQAKAMIATGIYIFVLSVIYLTNILAEDLFWKIFGGGFLIIIVLSFILFRKK